MEVIVLMTITLRNSKFTKYYINHLMPIWGLAMAVFGFSFFFQDLHNQNTTVSCIWLISGLIGVYKFLLPILFSISKNHPRLRSSLHFLTSLLFIFLLICYVWVAKMAVEAFDTNYIKLDETFKSIFNDYRKNAEKIEQIHHKYSCCGYGSLVVANLGNSSIQFIPLSCYKTTWGCVESIKFSHYLKLVWVGLCICVLALLALFGLFVNVVGLIMDLLEMLSTEQLEPETSDPEK